MDSTLDEKLLNALAKENIIDTFNKLVERKTDLLDGETRIAKGYDNICKEKFEKNIETNAQIICEKAKCGNYLFKPFREVIIPKAPYEKDQIQEAIKNKKTRTLSISTIQDTIFQDIILNVIYRFSEIKFIDIDMHSFGYRKNKSSKMAVNEIRKYLSQGYYYILDADIEKFFDKIDHRLLIQKCIDFFGKENELIIKYLYRFINVSRIPDCRYEGTNNGSIPIKRMEGIPQGGILSGLLANIFLYDFDKYVVKEILPKYNIKYIRYADDFVILSKNKYILMDIYDNVYEYIKNENLNIHPLGSKSSILDLSYESKDALDYLGFEITPKYLRVKKTNKVKFLHRIESIISKIDASNTNTYLKIICNNIKPKIIGLEELLSDLDYKNTNSGIYSYNEDYVTGYCPVCSNLLRKRSWIGYFMMIDDVRQLRDIDTKIRQIIYKDYHKKTGEYLNKKQLLAAGSQLLSLEKLYYKYKKQEKKIRQGKFQYCNCRRYFDKDLNRIVIEPVVMQINKINEREMYTSNK
ncbi:MAG: hypothetical protein JXN65_06630 [Clostridia bacterium]|nr:hypothetical protein [Clostridia bacterium]